VYKVYIIIKSDINVFLFNKLINSVYKINVLLNYSLFIYKYEYTALFLIPISLIYVITNVFTVLEEEVTHIDIILFIKKYIYLKID